MINFFFFFFCVGDLSLVFWWVECVRVLFCSRCEQFFFFVFFRLGQMIRHWRGRALTRYIPALCGVVCKV